MPRADVILAPYSAVLLPDARSSLGIQLEGSVVVFDEAHNLLDAINGAHSTAVTGGKLTDVVVVGQHYPLSAMLGHSRGHGQGWLQCCRVCGFSRLPKVGQLVSCSLFQQGRADKERQVEPANRGRGVYRWTQLLARGNMLDREVGDWLLQSDGCMNRPGATVGSIHPNHIQVQLAKFADMLVAQLVGLACC